MSKLLNWKEVSRKLSGNDNSIRSYKMPKKYVYKVHRLLRLLDEWENNLNKENDEK